MRNVEYHYSHEDFSLASTPNDIVLIFLDEPFEFTSLVNKIDLPEMNEDLTGFARVPGWSRIRKDNKISTALKKVESPIVSNEKCKKLYENTQWIVDDGTMCSGKEGNGACQVDSGGPVICKKENGSDVLCGVVAGGQGCGRAGYPYINTKVSYYLDWIKNSTGNLERTIK